MQWDIHDKKIVLKTIPFCVEELTLFDKRLQKDVKHPYHRLSCADWVNVLPVTADGEAILIKQSRAGSFTETLEVPGGMIDRNEKDPTMAALRELEEETGYTTKTILSLGAINPNPAIMANQVHMFLAMNVQENPNRRHFPDDGEDIELYKIRTNELDQMVRTRRIDSALACLTIMLAGKYVKIHE